MKVVYIVTAYPSVTEMFIAREIEAVHDVGVEVSIFVLRPLAGNTAKCPTDRTFASIVYSPHIPSLRSVGIHVARFLRTPLSYLKKLFSTLFGCPG